MSSQSTDLVPVSQLLLTQPSGQGGEENDPPQEPHIRVIIDLPAIATGLQWEVKVCVNEFDAQIT